MANKQICIHGHFYQPPRENAWIEQIEIQESAYPFHDWNERITYECYGPNAFSRILDDDRKICDIVNNYSKISFNIGPTLLSWMSEKTPLVYQAILDADKLSMKNFNGHGSALAQVYNHIIMPLASKRDKETQVKWGIADFEHRFNRKPEGMWLAETAVDTETLEVLSDHDIKFTILAPRQAHKVKYRGSSDWVEINSNIDPRKPYTCNLPSGKSIVCFFYDGNVSQAVAFEGLLKDGKLFANRLMGAVNYNDPNPQLVHIATDGESYGHHHRYGDMALAYCLRKIEESNEIELTNYGAFLEEFEVEHEVIIHENSSWSCVHGVERWRSNCGCSDGGGGRTQAWRKPLRDGLNWLRDELAAVFEEQMKPFHKDPWALRNAYIEVVLRKDTNYWRSFVQQNFKKDLSHDEIVKIFRMLESQRNSLLMFTSCGWFFDEVSRIETKQILQYAKRGIQIAEQESSARLEKRFLEFLKLAPSNDPDFGSAYEVYKREVVPAVLTLTKVAMVFAVESLLHEQPETLAVFNYEYKNEYVKRYELGNRRLVVGNSTIISKTTHSTKQYSYAVLYLGQHDLMGYFNERIDATVFSEMQKMLKTAFYQSNISEMISLMEKYLNHRKFSFWDLLKDNQQSLLDQLVRAQEDEAQFFFQKVYEQSVNLMNVMKSANLTLPMAFLKNQELVVNNRIERFFISKNLRPSVLEDLVALVKNWKIFLDHPSISFKARKRLLSELDYIGKQGYEWNHIEKIDKIFGLLQELNVVLDLTEIQNKVFSMAPIIEAQVKMATIKEEANTEKLLKSYLNLAARLNIKTDALIGNYELRIN